MFRYTTVSLLAIAVVTASAAYAAKSADNDAMAVAKANIPLAQAVTTAEQHANGKAARAEFEHTKLGWAYDVEVISGGKVFDVTVDATKGTVIASSEDTLDHDDGSDKED